MNQRKLTMNIGMISFMVVFIILCLVTFSILSLVSANSNLIMTQKRLTHTSDYYAISSQGEKRLAQIEAHLYDLYFSSDSKQSYLSQLETLKEIDSSMIIDDQSVFFDIIQDDLKLTVELEVTYPGTSLYTLKSWKVIPSTQWQPEQGIDIL